MNPEPAAPSEPTEWFVVFHRKSMNRILGWLAAGEYKHVAAVGYCPGVKVWLIYDVTWSGTRIKVLPHGEAALATINAWTDGCDLVKIPRANQTPHLLSRVGFYCVPSVKHLLGLRCVAATPTQLYRYLLRNGGALISGAARHTASPG